MYSLEIGIVSARKLFFQTFAGSFSLRFSRKVEISGK